MLHVHIITVGKLKEKFFVEAAAEYTKRLGRFVNLKVTELPEAPLPRDDNPTLIAAALEKEAAAITAAIPKGSYVITLCVEGKMMDSPALADLIEQLPQNGYDTLCLIIGSSYGLAPSVKQLSAVRLSFSPMTFPHQLMRIILLEQLYRACKIGHGESYHK